MVLFWSSPRDTQGHLATPSIKLLKILSPKILGEEIFFYFHTLDYGSGLPFEVNFRPGI